MKLSKEDARRFLVRHQHLDDLSSLSGKDGILEYFKKVGCIQYDPLNVVGRNADLVLQSRVCYYKEQMLHSLLYEDRSLIDAWDKVMSIYRTEDFPYFHRVREQRGKETIATLQYRDSSEAVETSEYIDIILTALSENGAMQPKQIGQGSAGSGTWGHRNIYGAAMDYLFHVGKLGVSNKLGVTKVYDLIENLVPSHILNAPAAFETEHEFFKWYVLRRIRSVGMLWNKSGGGWYGTLIPDKKTRERIFDELIHEGLVTAIEVDGIADKFYARSEDVSPEGVMASGQVDSKSVRFIAPLDNLIWDRGMVEKIFGFEYTWEVYVPAAKRKYGYYVLPVLFGNRFIARFEPEKSATHFRVKNWWWEKDVTVTGDMVDSVMQAMERFAEFLAKEQGVHKRVRRKLK